MAWGDPLPGGKMFRGAYRDSAGKKRYVRDLHGKVVHYKRKSDAKLAAQELEVAARRRAAPSEVPENAGITWGAWWDSQKSERDNPETNTFAKESQVVEKHIRPRWGDVALNQIQKRDVQNWVNSRQGLKVRTGMSPSYARRIYGIFRALVNTAVEQEVLAASPCVGIKLPKVPRKRKKFYTEDSFSEVELLPIWRDVVAFVRETGLRPGELGGLHADHIDFGRDVIEVEDVFVEGRDVIRAHPKDEDARAIPLTPKAREIALRQLKGRDLKAGCGIPHVDGSRCKSVLVFLSPRKKPAHPKNVRRALWMASRRAEQDTPGGLYPGRRGYATRLADGGIDIFTLADLLGHSDINLTREYVQQSAPPRARVLAALGQHSGLELVHGADGAELGADRDETGSDQSTTEAS